MQNEFTQAAYDHVLLCGRIDAPDSPKAAVVIVHGLCEHYGRYDYLVEKLNAAGYAVVRFDHRGHGRSMGKLVFFRDREDIVKDTNLFVEAATEAFPQLPLYMIGHSMGGFGAASYGTAYPKKLAGYVLTGAWTRDHKGLGIVDDNTPADTYLPNDLGDGVCSDPAVVKAYQEDPYVAKKMSADLLRAVHEGHGWLKENAQEFTDPVFLLHGGNDGLVDPRDSLDMFEEVSSQDKSLRVYAGLCHEIFNEFDRDIVIRDVIEWLDKRVDHAFSA
ncbi:MAG: alpha/beta hydrolase [Raoultibacter sp.]